MEWESRQIPVARSGRDSETSRVLAAYPSVQFLLVEGSTDDSRACTKSRESPYPSFNTQGHWGRARIPPHFSNGSIPSCQQRLNTSGNRREKKCAIPRGRVASACYVKEKQRSCPGPGTRGGAVVTELKEEGRSDLHDGSYSGRGRRRITQVWRHVDRRQRFSPVHEVFLAGLDHVCHFSFTCHCPRPSRCCGALSHPVSW